MKTSLPALYAIANLDESEDPVRECAELVTSGITLLQLRNKRLPSAEFSELATRVLLLRAQHPRCKILINDSIALARTLNADGVHLGQQDDSPHDARAILGKNALIGLSTHSLEDIARAPSEVLSYLAIGPVFSSSTKSGHAPVVGLSTLQDAASTVGLPLVAIGGITSENMESVFRHGANSVAVIADLKRTSDKAAYNAKAEALRKKAQR